MALTEEAVPHATASWFQRNRRSRRRLLVGLLFISPWILGFLIFTLYPFLATLYYSFTRYNIVSAPKWIGLSNYTHLLHDHLFWLSLWNTGYYTVLETKRRLKKKIGKEKKI